MNRQLLTRPILLCLLMLIAAGLSIAATPTKRLADSRPKVDLEEMIPSTFGSWQIDPGIVPLTVSPDVQAALDKVYNQTLARTYVNSKGERVMLSVAYGADQTDNVQVHLPEGCYSGQGFSVSEKTRGILQTAFGGLPVARLVAKKGPRSEPITYWIVVGSEATTDIWGMKKAKLRYALKGQIADGLLIRISSIMPDPSRAYAIQRDFTEAMLAGLRSEDRSRLVGAWVPSS